MSSKGAPRPWRRRLAPRVHRHLFGAPSQGVLVGAWSLGSGGGKTPDRYEEEGL